MNEQVYEIIFLTSFGIFLIISLFNFKREFSSNDYFIILPGIFFILNLYLFELKPLALYIYIIFLFYMISVIFKNIQTILLKRNFKKQSLFSKVIKIFIKIFITLPCFLILIVSLIFSYISLFSDHKVPIKSNYEVGFSKIKNYKENINVSVWYPISITLGLKKQNPFLSYKFNPFFINEMNYLSKHYSIYKNALISNNQKIYNAVLLILPLYSHDSMYKSLIIDIVKNGNIVYTYYQDIKLEKDFILKYKFFKKNNSFLNNILNKIAKYFIEPLNILKERKDKETTVAKIQKVINLIQSTRTKKYLNSKIDLNRLTLITIGNQANNVNEIIDKNTNIKKYINIGGAFKNIKNINNLQLILKQDEKKIKTDDIKSSFIKITNMTNVGEISDFIFSRKYLISFGLLKNANLLLSRFSFVVKEINKFIEGT